MTASPTAAVTAAPRLVLASGSPRRRELLTALGLRFEVRPTDLDETPRPAETPRQTVHRLAREKAAAAANGLRGHEVILAADTVVVVDGALLGKPADPAEARDMLRRLAGREHQVLTGVAVLDTESGTDGMASDVAQCAVWIAPLDAATIDWYVGTAEPLDKAGAYGVQGLGAFFVDRIEGNYTNVVGLPVPLVVALFGQLGYDWRAFRGDGSDSRPAAAAGSFGPFGASG